MKRKRDVRLDSNFQEKTWDDRHTQPKYPRVLVKKEKKRGSSCCFYCTDNKKKKEAPSLISCSPGLLFSRTISPFFSIALNWRGDSKNRDTHTHTRGAAAPCFDRITAVSVSPYSSRPSAPAAAFGSGGGRSQWSCTQPTRLRRQPSKLHNFLRLISLPVFNEWGKKITIHRWHLFTTTYASSNISTLLLWFSGLVQSLPVFHPPTPGACVTRREEEEGESGWLCTENCWLPRPRASLPVYNFPFVCFPPRYHPTTLYTPVTPCQQRRGVDYDSTRTSTCTREIHTKRKKVRLGISYWINC